MKKKIFNWLFTLVMLPCMLFINGCDNDDDKDLGEKKVITDYTSVNEVLASLNQNKNNAGFVNFLQMLIGLVIICVFSFFIGYLLFKMQ